MDGAVIGSTFFTCAAQQHAELFKRYNPHLFLALALALVYHGALCFGHLRAPTTPTSISSLQTTTREPGSITGTTLVYRLYR